MRLKLFERSMVYEAMRVLPTLGDWLTAYRVHRRFASRPGGKHIATWRALICLAALVRKDQSTAVLEFGTGIGTITYLLLSVSAKLNVVGLKTVRFVSSSFSGISRRSSRQG